MDKMEIIKKLAKIDATLSEQRFNRTMSEEQIRKLHDKRDRLERKLYR